MEMIYTLSQIESVCRTLLSQCSDKQVWAFHAPMGAGKTTLITTLCKLMGVEDRVSSPTFAIMNEYQGLDKTIYHMDWYRLENEIEARNAGVEMALETADYCFVEWPEKAPGLLPVDTQHFQIDIVDPYTRRIFIP